MTGIKIDVDRNALRGPATRQAHRRARPTGTGLATGRHLLPQSRELEAVHVQGAYYGPPGNR